jgi:hypothetical protein
MISPLEDTKPVGQDDPDDLIIKRLCKVIEKKKKYTKKELILLFDKFLPSSTTDTLLAGIEEGSFKDDQSLKSTLEKLTQKQEWGRVKESYLLMYEPFALDVFILLDQDKNGFLDKQELEGLLERFATLRDDGS